MITGKDRKTFQEIHDKSMATLKSPADSVKTALTFGQYLQEPIKKQTIVFQSKGGADTSGVPLFLFKKCMESGQFFHFNFIWCVNKGADISPLSGYKDIEIVYGKGRKYKELLATSEFIISDSRLPYYYLRRDGQTYLKMFEERYYQERQNYDLKENLDQKRMITKDLLNSSFILSYDSKMTKELLLDHYQLASIFEGGVVELNGNDWAFLFETICDILKKQKTEKVTYCTDERKKVLIYADFSKAEWWQRRLKRVLDQADYEKYDITLITKVVRDAKETKAIETLNPKIRVLMRSGHLNAEEKQYIAYDCLRQDVLAFDSAEELTAKLSEETVNNELRRIVGNAKFDLGILCDNEDKDLLGIWNLLFQSSNIKQRFFCSWDNFRLENHLAKLNSAQECYLQRYINIIKNYNAVILVSQDEVEYVSNMNLWPSDLKTVFLKDMLPKEYFLEDNRNTASCYYQGEQYFVLSEEGNERLKTISIVKELFPENYNCITNLTGYGEERFVNLLKKFREIKETNTNAKLYIIDNISYMKEESYNEINHYKLRNDVMVFGEVELRGEYFKQFDQYIIFDKDHRHEDMYLEAAKKFNMQIV